MTFSEEEFIGCDTAFEPSWFCISTYKSANDDKYTLPANKYLFNRVMDSPFVIAEHKRGIWKGRFQWLRRIMILLTDNFKGLVRIIKAIDATIVVHNMLIDFSGADETDSLFDLEKATVLTNMNDPRRSPNWLALNDALPEWAPSTTRRDQLTRYVSETYVSGWNYTPLEDGVGKDGVASLSEVINELEFSDGSDVDDDLTDEE